MHLVEREIQAALHSAFPKSDLPVFSTYPVHVRVFTLCFRMLCRIECLANHSSFLWWKNLERTMCDVLRFLHFVG